MPKRPTEEQMERAVAAGDPPVSAKHPADEEWLAAQQNWLASRRTASRPLRKRKSAARRVGRAPLAPHRAPGARSVRGHMFSCGRTRPTTICQAPVATGGQDAGGTSHGAARPPRARAGSGGHRTRHAPRPHSPRNPIALALLMPPTSVGAGPPRPDAPVPTNARRRAAGHVRRVGEAPQSFVRVSRKRCDPC